MTRKFEDLENIYNRYLAIHQYLENECIYHLPRTNLEFHTQIVSHGDVEMYLNHQGRCVSTAITTSITLCINYMSPNPKDKFHTSALMKETSDTHEFSVIDVQASHITPMMYYRNSRNGGYALSDGTVIPRNMTDEMYFQYSTLHDLQYSNSAAYNDRVGFADTMLPTNILNIKAEHVLENLTDNNIEDIHVCFDMIYNNIMIGGKHVGT